MAPWPTGYRTFQNLYNIKKVKYLRIKYNTCENLETKNIHADKLIHVNLGRQ
jgi:hypothetical protein